MDINTLSKDEGNIEPKQELEAIDENPVDSQIDSPSDVAESDHQASNASKEHLYGPDDAIYTFAVHNSAVIACDLHPRLDLAVSGGQDDWVYLWDTNTGDIAGTISTDTDTVTETIFSYTGKYLATADLFGFVFVLKISEIKSSDEEIARLIWQHSVGDMTWLRWHFAKSVLIAGSENGDIHITRFPKCKTKILPGFNVRCVAGELARDGRKLFVGYINGTIKLWDMKSCQALMTVDKNSIPLKFDDITAVACHNEFSLYAAGDENGRIVFCSDIGYVGSVQADSCIQCLSFSPAGSEMQICVSGSLNGQVAIWDYTRFCPLTVVNTQNKADGITTMTFLDHFTFAVGTKKGYIRGYDVRSGQRKFELTGHLGPIHRIAYKKDENIMLTCSDDWTASIFEPPTK